MTRKIKAAIDYARALVRGKAPEKLPGSGLRSAYLDEENKLATVWLFHPVVSRVSVEPGFVHIKVKARLGRRVRLARLDLKKALAGYSIRSKGNQGRLTHEVYLKGEHVASISRGGYRSPFYFSLSSRHVPKLVSALFGGAVKLSLPVKRSRAKAAH